MEIINAIRNHTIIPKYNKQLHQLRSGKWAAYHEEETQVLPIKDRVITFRSGLTFTPYANPTPCNAHCRFCSEELLRKHQQHLTAERVIINYDQYFDGLAEALKDLAHLKNVGLSLSGLEATSDPMWLMRLLTLLQKEEDVPTFNEKVLYTNGSGLAKHPDLIYALKETDFDRLEISRCHYDDEKNQKIMYINRNEAVHQNEGYEAMIRSVLPQVHVKNSCILTKIGVHDIHEVETYLEWAMSLGVKQVVFRELSRLDDNYIENNTKKWVEENRVPIDGLLTAVMPDLGTQRRHWSYKHSKAGYYYYNEYFDYKNQVEVIFETSSYNELMSRNESAVIQKLVFHSNGNLCGDWDPDSVVIGNYFETQASPLEDAVNCNNHE